MLNRLHVFARNKCTTFRWSRIPLLRSGELQFCCFGFVYSITKVNLLKTSKTRTTLSFASYRRLTYRDPLDQLTILCSVYQWAVTLLPFVSVRRLISYYSRLRVYDTSAFHTYIGTSSQRYSGRLDIHIENEDMFDCPKYFHVEPYRNLKQK
jgi:hypothetical protein